MNAFLEISLNSTDRYSGYFVEHMIENYQRNRIFILNYNEVKMELKNVALISIMKVVKTDFKPTDRTPYTFRERYFVEIQRMTYMKLINSFSTVDSLGRSDQRMMDRVCLTLISRGFIYLSCAPPFLPTPTIMCCPMHLSFQDNIEKFETNHGELTCMKSFLRGT